jgi:predicted metal-dependent phosphoesterase TrpH
MSNIITLEMHLHSVGSKDSLMQPWKIIEVADKKHIDKLFVTDHNEIGVAKRMQKKYPDQVMVGEEIFTTRGELIAYFVTKKVPGGLEPAEAIRLLKNQGAFISVPHPYDRQRNGWEEKDLLEILPGVDALEVFNSRCLSAKMNLSAASLAKEKHLLSTVGSDAHIYCEIGNSLVHLPDFEDADGLRKSLKLATFDTRLSPVWVHFGSRWAANVKRMGFSPREPSSVDE